ncbi:conjugal transfer protein TraB [Kitasatospora sp. HPMI-4]|uniref:conjugal transfer protein TraB n=1 Tax=Kitasatospora sp. HPMI-4 TaxID=3448443 RepID=UPI003F1AAB9C
MTDLVPYAPNLPEPGGDRPNFLNLARRITVLTASALALKEGLRSLQKRMEDDSEDMVKLSAMCAEAEVEPRFLALIEEAGAALLAVAEASGALAGAADDMESNSRAFNDAHEGEYRGVYEAVQASGVQQAKAGFYRNR